MNGDWSPHISSTSALATSTLDLHEKNGLDFWKPQYPGTNTLQNVYNYGVFSYSEIPNWHLTPTLNAVAAATVDQARCCPENNLLSSTTLSTQDTTNFTSSETPPPQLVEADPWNPPTNTLPVDDENDNEDWAPPDASWSNVEDWQAPTAPVKPAPTYFDDSSDELVGSGSYTSHNKHGSTSTLTNDSSQNSAGNKKSRRRRKKKQNDTAVTDVEKQSTSSSPVNVEEVTMMKQPEVVMTSQSDETATIGGCESDGEWTTPSLLKKRRSRARKED